MWSIIVWLWSLIYFLMINESGMSLFGLTLYLTLIGTQMPWNSCVHRLIMHAPQRKFSNTFSHAAQWTGSLSWQTSLVSLKVLLMWNLLKLKLFKKLSCWPKLNCMADNWKYVFFLISCEPWFKLAMDQYSEFIVLMIWMSMSFRFCLRGPMFLGWNNTVLGDSIPTCHMASGGLMLLLLTCTPLMDMGTRHASFKFLCDLFKF